MAQPAREGTGTSQHTALPVSPRHKSRMTPHTQTDLFFSRRCPGPLVKVCWRIKTPGPAPLSPRVVVTEAAP